MSSALLAVSGNTALREVVTVGVLVGTVVRTVERFCTYQFRSSMYFEKRRVEKPIARTAGNDNAHAVLPTLVCWRGRGKGKKIVKRYPGIQTTR